MQLRHAVKEVNGEGDSEGPERSIGNVGPVNGGMEHHGSRNGHDGLDGPFGDTIVMVGADSSILGDLGELGEMFTIFGAGECGGIVAEVFGDDDSKIASQSFEILFSLEGLRGN